MPIDYPRDESDNLAEATKADLEKRAADLNITGRSHMTKDELVEAIRDAEEGGGTGEADAYEGDS